MKINATQTKPITVDIDDSELYRITRTTILELINMHNIVGFYDELEIRDGKLYKVWWEDYGPYDPDRMTKVLRDATEDDRHVVAVLEILKREQS